MNDIDPCLRYASGIYTTFNGKLKSGHVSLIEWFAAKYCYNYPERRPTGSLLVYSLSYQQI